MAGIRVDKVAIRPGGVSRREGGDPMRSDVEDDQHRLVLPYHRFQEAERFIRRIMGHGTG